MVKLCYNYPPHISWFDVFFACGNGCVFKTDPKQHRKLSSRFNGLAKRLALETKTFVPLGFIANGY